MILVSLKNYGDAANAANKSFVCVESKEFEFFRYSARANGSKMLRVCLAFFLCAFLTVVTKAQQVNLNYSLTGSASSYPSLILRGGAACTSGAADAEGNGWLRLGDRDTAPKGYVLIDKPFSSEGGLNVQFEYKIYQNVKAKELNPDVVDGFCVFLYDGSVTKANFNLGREGAALGYSPNFTLSGSSNTKGISKAYLGVGIDSGGSFGLGGLSSPNSVGAGSTAVGNVVTIRGPYNRTVNGKFDPYGYIASSIHESALVIPFVLTSKNDGTRPSDTEMFRRLKVIVSPNSTKTDYQVAVYMQNGPNKAFYPVIKNHSIGRVPPENLKVGVSAVVNNSFIVEMRNLAITSPANYPSAGDVIAETASKPIVNTSNNSTRTLPMSNAGISVPAASGAITGKAVVDEVKSTPSLGATNSIPLNYLRESKLKPQQTNFNYPLRGPASSYPSLTLGGGAVCTSGVADADGNGWLRLGDRDIAPKGYCLVDKPFSTTEGLNIQFDYKIYKNANAKVLNPDVVDGFCVFLYDGSVLKTNFNIGGEAAALGYSPNWIASGASKEGVSKAYCGVGIDSDGSFGLGGLSSPNSIGVGSTAVGNVVTLRGPYNRTIKGKSDSYGYIASSINGMAPIIPFVLASMDNGVRPSDVDMFRRVKVVIAPNSTKTDCLVTVYMQSNPDAGFYPVISNQSIGKIPPKNIKVGLSAVVNNPFIIEMRNLGITIPAGDAPADYVIAKTASKPIVEVSDILTYTLEVSNTGNSTADEGEVTITDVLPAGLTLVDTPVFTSATGQSANFQYNGLSSKGVLNMSLNLSPNASGIITYRARVDAVKSASLVGTANIIPPAGFRDSNPINNRYTTQVLVKPSLITAEVTVPSRGRKTIVLKSTPASPNSTYSWTAVQDGDTPVSGFRDGKGKSINQSLAAKGEAGTVVYTVRPTAVVPRVLADGTVRGTVNIVGDPKNVMVRVVNPPTFALSGERPIAYGMLPANLANPSFVSRSTNVDYYKYYDRNGKKELSIAQVPAGDYYIQACSKAGFCSDRKRIRVVAGPQLSVAMRTDKNSLMEGEGANITLSLSPSTVRLQESVTFALDCAHSQLNPKNKAANPNTLWPSDRDKNLAQQADCTIPSSITFPAGSTQVTVPVQTLSDNVLYDDELLLLRAYNPYLGRATNSLSIEDATELNPDNLAITIDNGIAYDNDTLRVAARLPYGVTTAKDITVYLSEDRTKSDLSNLSNQPSFPSSVTIPGDRKSNAVEFDVLATNPGNMPAKLVLVGSCAGCKVNEAQIAIAGQRTPASTVLAANPQNTNRLPKITGIEKYPDNQVQIVNRWGVIVYEAKGYDDNKVAFNGRSNRGYIYDLPAGTYYYVVLLGENKKVINRVTGSMQIRRGGQAEEG